MAGDAGNDSTDPAPTVNITTTIREDADTEIRERIFRAKGSLAAWWEQASAWLLAHPDVLTEITDNMTRELAGRRRRR